jgi:urea transport system permease protein
VGPDLGQGYIVDAFMVVDLGGVGQLMGTVYAALGLGVFKQAPRGIDGCRARENRCSGFDHCLHSKTPTGTFCFEGQECRGLI